MLQKWATFLIIHAFSLQTLKEKALAIGNQIRYNGHTGETLGKLKYK